MINNDGGASLLFEARELKPYIEPVFGNGLREGEVYFCLMYCDEDLLIPEMRPVVFIGHNLNSEDLNQAYFQDAASYRAGVRRNAERDTDDAVFECFSVGKDGQTGVIFEYERALEELMRCSLKRKRASDHDTSPR